jgi:hypothetical protein
VVGGNEIEESAIVRGDDAIEYDDQDEGCRGCQDFRNHPSMCDLHSE